MAIGLTDEIHYSRIAGAIRALHGGTESYTPAEMAAYLATQGKELKPENIKKGITIFGVLGTLEYTGDSEPTTAAYYLYGTPSDSGNVAIAEGDGYTLYEGGLLPEWNKESHPYVFVVLGFLQYTVEFWPTKPVVEINDSGIASYGAATESTTVLCYTRNLDETEWGEAYTRTSNPENRNTVAPFWGNVDLYTVDGDLYLSGTDPIPLASNEPVAAVYGGEKLPVLPAEIKAYQYLTINRLTASGENADTFIVIGFAEEPQTIVKTNFISGDYDVFGTESGAYRGASCYTETEPDVWYVSDEADGGTTVNFNLLVWSNCTINTSAGELFMAATDPIPIYEQKE